MISVLVPTRGRPESMRRLMDSIWNTAHGSIEVIFYIDEDDLESYAMGEWWVNFGSRNDRLATQLVVGPRILLSEAWNMCWEKASYDIAMHCGDDIVFRTPGWDTIVTRVFDSIQDRIALVWGRDGLQDAQMATHGFIHRRWVETVGYFVPPYFASDYNDAWLLYVSQQLGRNIYVPEIYTEHMHPGAGKAEWDITHQERLARHREQDCDRVWAETLELRREDVAKLRAVMGR